MVTIGRSSCTPRRPAWGSPVHLRMPKTFLCSARERPIEQATDHRKPVWYERMSNTSPPSSSPRFHELAWYTRAGYPCRDLRPPRLLGRKCWDHLISCKGQPWGLVHGLHHISEWIPLDAGQNGCDVICRAPAILEYVQTKFPTAIDIGVEHLADKFDTRRFIGVLFLKMHN